MTRPSPKRAHRHGARWTPQDAETAMRTDITIDERAALLGRTYAAVDDWIRAYLRRPDDPFGLKPRARRKAPTLLAEARRVGASVVRGGSRAGDPSSRR